MVSGTKITNALILNTENETVNHKLIQKLNREEKRRREKEKKEREKQKKER